MSKTREKYVVAGVDLYHVCNRNELRVAKSLADLIESKQLDDISPEAIKDVFAYALNQLPARYTQQGTIVLRDPVRSEDIDQVVADALLYILQNPKN